MYFPTWFLYLSSSCVLRPFEGRFGFHTSGTLSMNEVVFVSPWFDVSLHKQVSAYLYYK
jgi:hypothetical protein